MPSDARALKAATFWQSPKATATCANSSALFIPRIFKEILANGCVLVNPPIIPKASGSSYSPTKLPSESISNLLNGEYPFKAA